MWSCGFILWSGKQRILLHFCGYLWIAIAFVSCLRRLVLTEPGKYCARHTGHACSSSLCIPRWVGLTPSSCISAILTNVHRVRLHAIDRKSVLHQYSQAQNTTKSPFKEMSDETAVASELSRTNFAIQKLCCSTSSCEVCIDGFRGCCVRKGLT